LVGLAIESALAQTIADLEVLVVGDGVPDVTRTIVGELAARDSRVEFFDLPKGPNRGEVNRDAVLRAHGRGNAILYLADDDLFLPDHAERMLNALRHADFVSAPALIGQPDGSLKLIATDARHPEVRKYADHLEGGLGIGLSQAGHTAAAYSALPEGWHTTPDSLPTDQYMWRRFLADERFRVGRTGRPTVLSLPTPVRRGWPLERRFEEMHQWWERLNDAQARAALLEEAWDAAIAWGTGQTAERRREQERLIHLRGRLAASQAKVKELRRRRHSRGARWFRLPW
jgi:hypothetical protein